MSFGRVEKDPGSAPPGPNHAPGRKPFLLGVLGGTLVEERAGGTAGSIDADVVDGGRRVLFLEYSEGEEDIVAASGFDPPP